MQTAITLIIVLLAAAYLAYRAVQISRAARKGQGGCACCSEKKICAKAHSEQNRCLSSLELKNSEE